MNEQGPTAVRRRWWRFSLRELMLVMLAVAGFVAWGVLLYERSQRFQPSAFFESAPAWRDDIRAALKEIGEPGSASMPFAVTTAGGPSAHLSESYSFPLAAANSATFHKAFRLQVRSRLTGAGCKILGEGQGSSGSSQVAVLSYRLESRAGAIHIAAFKNDNDQERIVITMHEEAAWRGKYGVGVSAGS
jgi:hypothetical protein